MAADPLELAFLEDAEQLGLRLGGQLADLVEEERAAVGQLEPADPAGDRAGERPLLVAEQLALDEARGQGRAVDLDQRLTGPPARGVDGPGDQLLAGAGLAGDEHGGVGGGNAATLSSTASSAGLRPTISSKLWTDLISSWR